jgi:acyl-CoA synthetase (AMP-forming)/AMP-acid ligase II/acyl carrier protein
MDSALAASVRGGPIAERARRDPASLALLAPDRPALTFGSLLAEVERLAGALADVGIGRGDRVAVALPTGPELAMTVLAISDCCTCVPFNPTLDEAACARLLESTRARALLVPQEGDSTGARVARSLGIDVVRVASSPRDPAGKLELLIDAPRNPRPRDPVQADDVALLMHTSGTTGRPKSVPLSHRILGASVVIPAQEMRVTRADRCLGVTPLFTNAGIRRCLLTPLVFGGSAVCTRGFKAGAFVEWLEEFAPTYYAAAPVVHLELLAECERRGIVPKHSLRFVWSGATPLTSSVESRLERLLKVPIIHAYGMCEAGTMACSRLPPGPRKPGSVGLPLATEISIRDDARRPLPPEGIGDVWVSSPSVIAAYENDPELNAQIFDRGWFKTGDLGYFDKDGYLFLTGRSKEAINRGGLKVSPSEVDAALLAHADVADAATFAVPHSTLGEDVVAAVVLRPSSSATAQQLRDHAFQRLAPFKVPSRVVLVPELPKTVQGKVVRRELPHKLARYLRAEYVPAAQEHEELVARCFAEVLGVDRIGAQDNFFDLGGDSLRGAQVVARVNVALDVDLDPTSLFRRPTVAEFAAELTSIAGAKPN